MNDMEKLFNKHLADGSLVGRSGETVTCPTCGWSGKMFQLSQSEVHAPFDHHLAGREGEERFCPECRQKLGEYIWCMS